MADKYVYDFSEGNKDMRELLGGKGANLAEMTSIGLPGAARLHHHDRGLQLLLRQRRLPRRPRGAGRGRPRSTLEQNTGKKLRRPRRPAARSACAPAPAPACRA